MELQLLSLSFETRKYSNNAEIYNIKKMKYCIFFQYEMKVIRFHNSIMFEAIVFAE
jgi:hypothetical protein